MPTDRKYRIIVRGELVWADMSKMEELATALKEVFEKYGGREPEITMLPDTTSAAR